MLFCSIFKLSRECSYGDESKKPPVHKRISMRWILLISTTFMVEIKRKMGFLLHSWVATNIFIFFQAFKHNLLRYASGIHKSKLKTLSIQSKNFNALRINTLCSYFKYFRMPHGIFFLSNFVVCAAESSCFVVWKKFCLLKLCF